MEFVRYYGEFENDDDVGFARDYEEFKGSSRRNP